MTLTCCCLLAALTVSTWTQSKAGQPAPELADKLLLIDGTYLASVRGRVRAGDPTLAPAVAALEDDAKKAVALKPPSVMDKTIIPPSGDKHDYMSQAPYWWPDPAKPDGRPYIRRDGERNPEINRITDHDNLGRLTSSRIDARTRVQHDGPRRICRTGGASRADLVPRSRDADEPALELRPGHSRHQRGARHRHHRNPRLFRRCSTACG